MAETTYEVELLNGNISKIFAGVYNDFKAKAVNEYKFELEPLPYEEFIDAVEKIDSSLEEKFNDTLKRFSFVKEELAPKIIKEEACLPIANYGKEFSDMRNAIGHGFPPEIENKHVVLFRITRVLIYTLILSECGFTENKIRTMLIKLKM